jgi:hypothetical protein
MIGYHKLDKLLSIFVIAHHSTTSVQASKVFESRFPLFLLVESKQADCRVARQMAHNPTYKLFLLLYSSHLTLLRPFVSVEDVDIIQTPHKKKPHAGLLPK